MSCYHLIKELKNIFKCKVVLTVHYFDWSFDLLGDNQKFKKILNANQNDLDSFEKKIATDFREEIRMIKSCDCFICIAQHSFNSLVENSDVNIKKGVIINNGLIDENKKYSKEKLMSIRKKYFIESSTKIILFAGRPDPVKGLEYLINSFKYVLEKHPDCLLVIAGDSDFNRLHKKIGFSWTKIIFTGRLEKKQLYEFYQIADIGVVPSIYEEFGYVAIEMMMHQLPIVVTNTGGLAEIVEDGVSGFQIPVRKEEKGHVVDEDSLTDKICYLLEHQKEAEIIGFNARKRFLEKYEISLFEKEVKNTVVY